MYRVADGESYGAQTVAREFPSAGTQSKVKEAEHSYDDIADRILGNAENDAASIERPVWRDRALVECAVNAAGGRRYRALELLVKQKRMAKTQAVPCVVLCAENRIANPYFCN